jgi:FkbM family methyltransferase
MISIFARFKERIERISGCRIYRKTLPHGVDCYLDIEKKMGREAVKVVFDVGANVGQSAIRYVHEFPHAEIYSFEPVAATYQQLVAATQGYSRIKPYNLGMGREPGKMTIHVNPLNLVSSIKQCRPEDHPETIELESIESFAKKHHVETIDFLKIDTEGYDLEVLAGATQLLRRQQIHYVLSECEPVSRTNYFVGFPALVEFMGGFGYRLSGVYEQSLETDGTLAYWNALFICEKLTGQAAKCGVGGYVLAPGIRNENIR